MSKLTLKKAVPASELIPELLAILESPKDDGILKEAPVAGSLLVPDLNSGAKRVPNSIEFTLEEGPFTEYKRKIELEYAGDADTIYISETCNFKLAVPVWKVLLIPLIKRSFKTTFKTNSPVNSPIYKSKPAGIPKNRPFWAPAVRMDARSAHVLSILCLLSVIGGYLGTLLSQTITFVGDDFGFNTRTQGYLLAFIRVGVILAFVLAASADRYGRRQIVRLTAFFGCIFTLLTAASVDIFSYATFQTLARALGAGFAILIGIMAAEETPAGARAYAVSVLSLSAALGAGGVVWLLPVADLGADGGGTWRILYLVPALALIGLVPLFKALPETSRFQQIQENKAERNENRQNKNAAHKNPVYRARLWLLGASAFLLSIFLTPASQFQNEFLRDERGFSGSRLTLFQLGTNTPGGIGVLAGGKLADLRGRKLVGAVGLLGGSFFIVGRYLIGGWSMWVSGGMSAILTAAIIPALGVYSPELFSTSRRGRFGGMLAIVAVSGSAVGLILVGWLADVFNSFGSAFALVAAAPLIVAILVLVKFPETANIELEELSPEEKEAEEEAEGAAIQPPTAGGGLQPDH